MIPPKLERGDEVRIVAPARSLQFISESSREIALQRLRDIGLEVTLGEHVNESDMFDSTTIENRVEDLHEGFRDDNVKAILTVIGGFNSNQLLDYLDYDLIRENPTILCGYSDITALHNAIYAKTGLVTYSGPHLSTFGMKRGWSYTPKYWKKCLWQEDNYEVKPSEEWSDDEWYFNQEDREFIENEGPTIINEGEAEGTLIGSNQCTLNLLQGTEYMPTLKDTIVFLEEDEWIGDTTDVWFDRNLQSLIHQPNFDQVQAIAIGRFQKKQ